MRMCIKAVFKIKVLSDVTVNISFTIKTWLMKHIMKYVPSKMMQTIVFARRGVMLYFISIISTVPLLKLTHFRITKTKPLLAKAMHESLWILLVCLRFNQPGGRLNKKDGLTRYGDSHVKDKTS